MPISSLQLRNTLQKPYDRIIFSKEVLSPVFNNGFSLSSSLLRANIPPTQSESKVISDVFIYGQINLEDGTEITCYEVNLQPDVRINYSKVAIQHYVRRLLTAGQAAFINFVSPSDKNLWRFSLVAKDSILTDTGIKERTTNSKRYTYLLGPYESCKTAAERFETLSTQTRIDFESLVNAFSVEKLSKAFFDEYTRHYESFVEYITKSNYKKVVFNGDEKAIRDFTKKLLGRIVFLYFVQKKGWLGATDTDYKDGNKNFIMDLFTQSGAGENFYPQWLTTLFFDTLNNSSRKDDVFEMPDGSKIKIPFLNGGLFDKEEYDEKLLTFKSKLFHNHNNDEDPKERGFLDFLNAFNFTIYEDSPDEKTVAVDPEMLGHIFENLLEDNKDKGAFYTPKEIVHYMCQESLIEYLSTHLSKEYTVYRPIDSEQVEIFGNETRTGQLKIIEEIGDKALNRDDVRNMVKRKDIDNLTLEQIKLIDRLIDNVKICDPAIGSGAFPMGLLLEIYSLKELIAYKFGLEWKPYQVKENIIQKSIYGVDIEKGAVDIARLRFWLSLVVDEDKPKPLPNLDYKIVVGNSLVSKFDGEIVEIEWTRTKVGPSGEIYVNNIQRLLKELTEKQKQYFDSANSNKKKLSNEIKYLKIELLINQISLNRLIYINNNQEVLDSGFGLSAKEKAKNAEILLTIANFDNIIKDLSKLRANPKLEFNHFDWKLDFPEILNQYLINDNGGFDIVVANPPYLKERDNAHIFREVNNSNFGRLWHEGKMDYWFYFLHKAIDINKKLGTIAFITSRYWLNSKGAKKLIGRVSKTLSFTNVVDIGKLKIFDNVVGQHMIHIYKNSNVELFIYKRLRNNIYSIDSDKNTNDVEIKLLNNKTVFTKNDEIIFSDVSLSINTDTKELGELFLVSQGVVEAPDKVSSKQYNEYPQKDISIGQGVFVLSEKEVSDLKLTSEEKKILKPYLDPSDVGRYVISKKEPKYLIYSDKNSKILIANDVAYKNIKKHLDKLKKYITSSNKPYGLHRPRKKVFFENSKIIFKNMFTRPQFVYDDNKYYFGFSFSSVILNNDQYLLKYLLAILNSKFAEGWFYINGKMRGGGVDIGVEKLRTFPVATATRPDLIVTLVDYINYLKDPDNNEDLIIVSYLEQMLDGIVYELYFPAILKKHNREILKHLGELPAIENEMSDAKKAEIIKKVFNRLNAKDHPVRVNLFYMNSIPEIRIIEGKNENN